MEFEIVHKIEILLCIRNSEGKVLVKYNEREQMYEFPSRVVDPMYFNKGTIKELISELEELGIYIEEIKEWKGDIEEKIEPSYRRGYKEEVKLKKIFIVLYKEISKFTIDEEKYSQSEKEKKIKWIKIGEEAKIGMVAPPVIPSFLKKSTL